MAEAPTTPDDERDRLAREDEARERTSQDAERTAWGRSDDSAPTTAAPLFSDAPRSDTAFRPGSTDRAPSDAPHQSDPPRSDSPHYSDSTDAPPSSDAPADRPPTADPPTLIEPDPAEADALERERRAQADDERPSDIAEDPGYDALPANEHVAHGDAGTDIVDEPGEPDVPEQERYSPTVAVPTGMALAPEASDAVFVEPPIEPRARHNRLFGVGMVLLSTIVFTALYAGLAALLIGFVTLPQNFVGAFTEFLRAPVLLVPIAAYAVLGILSALLVNRARWWAHTIMSLVVGLLVYAVSVAVILLLSGWATQGAEAQRVLLVRALTEPVLIAAGFAARETLLWFGLAISARGRRVVARNRSEREDYETRLARSETVWDGRAG